MQYAATLLFFLATVVCFCAGTQVRPCANSKSTSEDLSSRVKVGNCKKPPCRLKKNTDVDVIMKFKSEFDADTVTNTVNSLIAGIPFPFPGVDGTSACDSIFDAAGTKKVGCPLKAGQEYTYKNKIEVLQIYPSIKVMVHWGLTTPKGDAVCIEVPGRITN